MLERSLAVIAVMSGAMLAACHTPQATSGDDDDARRITALPRLNGTTPQDRRIDAEFARLDAAIEQASKDCVSAAPAVSSWTRDVTVTLNGPRFLSLRIWDALGCSSPTSYGFDSRLTFDRTTGLPIDWTQFAPAYVVDPILTEPAKVTVVDGRLSIPVSRTESRILWDWFRPRVWAENADDPDFARMCNGFYEPQAEWRPLFIWLDGERGGLGLSASELGRMDSTLICGVDVLMPADEMRRLGFDEALIEAVSSGDE